MESSIPIARIISVIYISTGIAVLIGTIKFIDVVNNLENSPALTFMAGSVGIIVGILLVTYHNIWVKNWSVLITLISWAALIGGILVVVFPRSISWGKGFLKNSKLLGICMVVFGAILGYFGFIK